MRVGPKVPRGASVQRTRLPGRGSVSAGRSFDGVKSAPQQGMFAVGAV
jgi:hypothetical protein